MANNIHRIHVGSQLLELDGEQVKYLYKKLEEILTDVEEKNQSEFDFGVQKNEFPYDISN